MRKLFTIMSLLMVLFTVGCCRSAGEVWDDTKTAGRHMGRGMQSFAGKHGDSKQVECRDDFYLCEADDWDDVEFIALPDEEIDIERLKASGKSAPPASAFKSPSAFPGLGGLFANVNFPYNSSQIQGEKHRKALKEMSVYLKKHPGVYVFIEGHCDERGAEAYNLALGTRRCHAVRDALVKEGVDPGHLFTVSYGKEKPFDPGHTEQAWAKNRRAEFKIYQR